MVSSHEASTYGFYANVAIACILSIVYLGKAGADWMPPEPLSQEQWMDTHYGKQVAASFSLVLLATLAGVAAGLLAFGKKQWKRAGVACIIAFVLTCLSFVWFIRRCETTFGYTICVQLDFEWFHGMLIGSLISFGFAAYFAYSVHGEAARLDLPK